MNRTAIRVLHMLQTTDRGGTEMLVLDVCRNAKLYGLEITLVALDKGELEEEFRLSGVEFLCKQRKMPIDLGVVYFLRKLIKDRGIEIVHCHQAVEGIHAYLAILGTPVKLAQSFHGYARDRKNKYGEKLLIPRVDSKIVVSKAFLEGLVDKAGLRSTKGFHVIYNGVDKNRLRPSGASLRAELQLKQSDILVGMVGNFQKAKDHLTLCQGLLAILSQIQNVHLIFAGRKVKECPEVFDQCVAFCRENEMLNHVHMLGPRSDVPDILSALDYFVFSSLTDTFAIAVVEAMMMGLPAILSDIPSLIEISGGGNYASLFRKKDPEDFACKLIKLIKNPAEAQALGASGRKWAEEQFGIETHINSLRDLYKELIERKTQQRST